MSGLCPSYQQKTDFALTKDVDMYTTNGTAAGTNSLSDERSERRSLMRRNSTVR